MGDHALLTRLQKGETIPLSEFTKKYDPVTRLILENGGILPFAMKLREGLIDLPAVSQRPRPMTMVEKIVAKKLIGKEKKIAMCPRRCRPSYGRRGLLT